MVTFLRSFISPEKVGKLISTVFHEIGMNHAKFQKKIKILFFTLTTWLNSKFAIYAKYNFFIKY